jgi:hypothetical protein
MYRVQYNSPEMHKEESFVHPLRDIFHDSSFSVKHV